MNLSLAKSLSKLTAGTQVTVNTIMPGSTLTEGVETMLKTMYQESDLPESMWEEDFMKSIAHCLKFNGSFVQKRLDAL